MNLHFNTATTLLPDPAASTASAPPLLLAIDPVAPHATEILLFLKLHCSTMRCDKATPLTNTAPPPPLVEPGLLGHDKAAPEHDEKLESKMETVRSSPLDAAARSSERKPLSKRASCGD
jgi:hypothetical protein